MKELYLIDGNSLLFRAYYATSFPGAPLMRTKDGTPTNAINAFANMINKILDFLPINEGIVVAFDTGHKTFRHEQFKDYKAQRKEGPEELFIQMPLARDFLHSLNIPCLEIDGYEGDDIIGTLAKKASKDRIKVFIFTSDRDFLQLIDDNISVHILKSGLKDVKVYHHQEVIDEYGIRPDQMIDYKALCGDSSDNYKGVPGIGPKKAEQLLNQYNDFENILTNADGIGGKFGPLLVEHEEAGRMCKMLATIHLSVPVDFDLKSAQYTGYNLDTALGFLRSLEMFNFAKWLNKKHLQSQDSSNDKIAYHELSEYKERELSGEISVFLDIEKGNYHNSTVKGLAIVTDTGKYYVPFLNLTMNSSWHNLFNDSNITINTFDLKQLHYILTKNGFKIKCRFFDTLLAYYLLDSSSSKDIHTIFLNYGTQVSRCYERDNDKNNEEFSVEIANAIHYSKKEILEKIKLNSLENLLYNVEIPLSIVLSKMEYEGFPLNKTVMADFKKEYDFKISEISTKIYSLANKKFNIASPKQVGEVIFDNLGLDSNKKRSTSSDYLKYLINKHPIIPLILEHRKYAKLLSTYIESLGEHIQTDGKIHTIYNQALTTTGRLSSQEPNMQNITIRDEEGRKIRKAFFYPNHEYKILSFDYANVELRILASLAKCESLIAAFKNGLDVHTETAKRVFGVDVPTFDQRRKAKAVTFGIVYGISDWGLSEQLEIAVEESRLIISQFYAAYPEIALYMNEIAMFAQTNGYVETIFKRRRYLRELNDTNYNVRENARRAAINAPIQGSAADIIKIAMVQLDELLANFKTQLVLQIHDELIFKVPHDEINIIQVKIKEIMESAAVVDARLDVGGGLGDTWFEAK